WEVGGGWEVGRVGLGGVGQSEDVGLCLLFRRQEPRDLFVVIGGVFKSREGKPEAEVNRQPAAVLIEFRRDHGVIIWVNDYGDIVVILGRRTDHRRAPDVNVFDRLLHSHIGFLNRLAEWIEVDHDQVNRLYAALTHPG